MSVRTARCRHGWRWYADCQECAFEREAEAAEKVVQVRAQSQGFAYEIGRALNDAILNEIVNARWHERFTFKVKL